MASRNLVAILSGIIAGILTIPCNILWVSCYTYYAYTWWVIWIISLVFIGIAAFLALLRRYVAAKYFFALLGLAFFIVSSIQICPLFSISLI